MPLCLSRTRGEDLPHHGDAPQTPSCCPLRPPPARGLRPVRSAAQVSPKDHAPRSIQRLLLGNPRPARGRWARAAELLSHWHPRGCRGTGTPVTHVPPAQCGALGPATGTPHRPWGAGEGGGGSEAGKSPFSGLGGLCRPRTPPASMRESLISVHPSGSSAFSNTRAYVVISRPVLFVAGFLVIVTYGEAHVCRGPFWKYFSPLPETSK